MYEMIKPSCQRSGHTFQWLVPFLVAGVVMTGYPLDTIRAAPTRSEAEARRSRAKKHFAKGKAFFKKNDYATALRHYEIAYSLAKLPALIFNIGQCYRNLGDLNKAIDSFQRYLAADPKAKNREAVEKLVAQLNAKLIESGETEKPSPAPKKAAAPNKKPHQASPAPVGNEATQKHAATSVENGVEVEERSYLDELPQARDLYTEEFQQPRSSYRDAAVLRKAQAPQEKPKQPNTPALRTPIYRTWWFWTALSAVVVGGVVTGIVLASGNRAADLPPSRIPTWELPEFR